MTHQASVSHGDGAESRRGFLIWWHRTPLYIRILIGLVLGVLTGVALGEHASVLAVPGRLILRLLAALAPPLILFAIVRVLMVSHIRGRVAWRMIGLLAANTLVAILIGLAVANVLQPGRGAEIEPPDTTIGSSETEGDQRAVGTPTDPLTQFLDNIPKSLLGPLGDNGNVLGVVVIAVAFGIALRRMRDRPLNTLADAVTTAFDALVMLLHWVIDIIPIGVFGIVASVVGTQGFAPFLALGWLVVAVLVALVLQTVYYLTRIRLQSWVHPVAVLKGMRDALVMAFSTASSTATMPVTYSCLRNRVGLREESASMGALVGGNFNNDGTALYEAVAALFVSQLAAVNVELDLTQQLILVVTSVIASVGAAGIPEAGLVTMTLVFTAVGLPLWPIPLLLTVDWFLDRCRTTINVLGDVTVACLLDGRNPAAPEPAMAEDPTPNPAAAIEDAPAGTAVPRV